MLLAAHDRCPAPGWSSGLAKLGVTGGRTPTHDGLPEPAAACPWVMGSAACRFHRQGAPVCSRVRLRMMRGLSVTGSREVDTDYGEAVDRHVMIAVAV